MSKTFYVKHLRPRETKKLNKIVKIIEGTDVYKRQVLDKAFQYFHHFQVLNHDKAVKDEVGVTETTNSNKKINKIINSCK